MQECEIGEVTIRRTSHGLSFAAPPLLRSGSVEESLVERIANLPGIGRGEILHARWVDNGPGWVAVLLGSADAVLALRPGVIDMPIGVVGSYAPGSDVDFELRAFFPERVTTEDPVTGSLNASVGQWLLGTGKATSPYVASQGTALGRTGRVHVSRDGDGTVWVGGGTVTCIAGEVDL